MHAQQGPFWMAIEIDGEVHRFAVTPPDAPAEWTWQVPGRAVEWRVEFGIEPHAWTVRSSLVNGGDRAHALGRVTLLGVDELTLGDAGDTVALLPVGKLGRQYCYAAEDPELPRVSLTRTMMANTTQGTALDLGFVTFQRCQTEICFADVGVTADGRMALHDVSADCDFAGWSLEPGESTVTEELRVAWGADPYALMEQWADVAAERVAPRIWQDPPLGYLGWSWTDATNGSESYQDVTFANLDAINERLNGFGINYLWTSMSNLAGSTPGRWLEWNDRCIPMGREKFLAEVAKRGFVPGLWVGPFYVSSGLPEAMERLGDALLLDEDGAPLVVCPEWRHGDAGMLPRGERPVLYALDPSHPKAREYIAEVFGAYREWGIRYYMVDFLEAGAGVVGRFPYRGHHDQSVVAGPEAYSGFLRELHRAAGEDTYLLSSTGPTHHNAGLVDGVRVGNDFGEGRPISPDTFFYPASYVVNGMDFWTGPQYCLVNWGANFHTHRRLYLNDTGNVLTVDRPVPLSHARVAATIHAMSGGATMLGDDIRRITDERLQLIKKTLPRPEETARPLDLFSSLHPIGPRVFWRHVDGVGGSYDVVALFNLGDEPLRVDLDPSTMGRSVEDSLLVWDFWNEQFLGVRRGSWTVTVDPESVRVLRLTPCEGRPTVVGTDLHVLMGEVELIENTWNAADRSLTIGVRRPAGERGTVFVWAPDNVAVTDIDELHIAKEPRDNMLVIGVPIDVGDEGVMQRSIRFTPLTEVLDMTTLDLA